MLESHNFGFWVSPEGVTPEGETVSGTDMYPSCKISRRSARPSPRYLQPDRCIQLLISDIRHIALRLSIVTPHSTYQTDTDMICTLFIIDVLKRISASFGLWTRDDSYFHILRGRLRME